MLKVLKEILIYVLLILLIILVFGILFYDQLPSNKLVPTQQDYALPENLESALEDTLSDEEDQEVLVTYTVEEADLDKYENIDQYNPGKIDPFSEYSDGTVNNNTPSDNNQQNGNNNNTSNTNGLSGGELTETKPGK